MTKKDEGFALPTQGQKQDFVLSEVSYLMGMFHQDEIQVSNLDQVNLQLRMPAIANVVEQFKSLEDRGYSKSDSSMVTLYHRFDDDTAVAANVSFDKTRDVVIISMNY
jgi:hypothetical protein